MSLAAGICRCIGRLSFGGNCTFLRIFLAIAKFRSETRSGYCSFLGFGKMNNVVFPEGAIHRRHGGLAKDQRKASTMNPFFPCIRLDELFPMPSAAKENPPHDFLSKANSGHAVKKLAGELTAEFDTEDMENVAMSCSEK